MRRFIFRAIGALSLIVVGGVAGYGLSGAIEDLRAMFLSPRPQTEASAAWDDFSNRIRKLGDRILEEDFPSGSDVDRAEGIRHLSHVIVAGLQWEFDHGGTRPSRLMVSNTDLTAWGAPNVDNEYYRARIDPSASYTLYGSAKGLADVAIQTNKGDMHQGELGASETLDLSKLRLDDAGNFVLHIGPDQRDGNWLKPGEDHAILTVRTYLVDWESDEFGGFHLVESGREGVAPQPLTEVEAASRLGRAANWIESNVVGWNRWFGMALAGAPENQALAPQFVEGGSSNLLYGGIPMNLPEGMALLIEFADPKADYFSYQTYRTGWYSPGDFANRQTSLNQKQTWVGADGRVQIVASAVDPEIQNWLDTEGRREGLIVFRYINAENSDLPDVRLVPQGELASLLAEETPQVDAEGRRASMAVRQRHVQRRSHN